MIPEPLDLSTAVVLGVDPSFTRTGIALIQPSLPGQDHVNAWSFVTKRVPKRVPVETDAQADARRIDAITAEVLQFARAWAVDVVCVEQPYMGENPSTALRLRALSAAIEYACRAAGYTVVQVDPQTRGRAVGVVRRLKRDALKAAIVAAVKLLYGLTVTCDDEADAVAIGLAGRNKLRLQQLTAAQTAARKPLPGLGKYGPKKRRRKGAAR